MCLLETIQRIFYERDKQEHFLIGAYGMGCALASTLIALARVETQGAMRATIDGLFATFFLIFFAAWAKEYFYDKKLKRGTFDWLDIIATQWGTLVVLVSVLIIAILLWLGK